MKTLPPVFMSVWNWLNAVARWSISNWWPYTVTWPLTSHKTTTTAAVTIISRESCDVLICVRPFFLHHIVVVPHVRDETQCQLVQKNGHLTCYFTPWNNYIARKMGPNVLRPTERPTCRPYVLLAESSKHETSKFHRLFSRQECWLIHGIITTCSDMM